MIDAINTSGDLFIESINDDGYTDYSISESTIKCPAFGNCLIKINDQERGGLYADIIAQPTTNLLSITAKGDRSLYDADITCPEISPDIHQPNCIINNMATTYTHNI